MIRQVWINNTILAAHAYDDKTYIGVFSAAI